MLNGRSRWIPPLLFLIAAAIPLWSGFFLGYSIGPFDEIRTMLPWSGPAAGKPWDILQADGVLQLYPWRDLVLDAWSKHQVPLWNAFELAGTPLLANSQSGGFYPLHILLGLLHVPTAFAIVLLATLHLAWAGFGVFRLAKSLGGSTLGGLIGGLSFTLSPFLLAWTSNGSVISTISWIPWVFYAISELASGQSRSPKFIALLGLSTGMMLLAGHLQFSFYGLMLAIGFALILGILRFREAGPMAIPRCALGVILGVFLAAAQVLPATQFGKLSNRQNKPSEDGYQHYIDLAIKPFELGGLTNPAALGYPRDQVDEQHPSLSTYWPVFLKNGASYAESAICLGPLVFALLGLAAWKDRKVAAIGAVGAVALLLCLGTGLNRLLYFGIPNWSATGSPGRVVAIFVLIACAIAGSAIRGPVSLEKKKLVAPVLLLVFGVLCSLYAISLAPAADQRAEKTVEAVQAAAGNHSLTDLLFGTVLGGIGLGLLLTPKLAKFRVAAFGVPVAFCLACYGLDLVPMGAPLAKVDGPDSGKRVAYLNSQWSQLEPSKANLPPNIASLNRIHELGGYDSLMSGETVLMLQDVNGGNPAPDINGNIMFVKTANMDKLREAGVDFVNDGTGLQPVLNALGRASLPGGTATIQAEDYSSVTVSANGAGVLTLRDRNLPGWSAEVDGKRVELPSGLWMAVKLEGGGAHQVVFRYDPPGLKQGLILSVIGLAGILVCAFVRPKRAASESSEPSVS